jgi:hypothetical protein
MAACPPVSVTKELLETWLKDPALPRLGFELGTEVCLHHVSGLVAYYHFKRDDVCYELPSKWCACGKPKCGAPHFRSLEEAVHRALEIIDDDDVVYFSK